MGENNWRLRSLGLVLLCGLVAVSAVRVGAPQGKFVRGEFKTTKKSEKAECAQATVVRKYVSDRFWFNLIPINGEIWDDDEELSASLDDDRADEVIKERGKVA